MGRATELIALCDLKLTCYRYTAASSMCQSYFMEPPIKDGKCDSYWETFNTK
jgi:hypothetical protein